MEKLLQVTSTTRPAQTLPPRPALSSLRAVNENPRSPYLDGRPPQLVQPQEQQQRHQHEGVGGMSGMEQQLAPMGNGVLGPELPEQERIRLYVHRSVEMEGAELVTQPADVLVGVPPTATASPMDLLPSAGAPPAHEPLGVAEVRVPRTPAAAREAHARPWAQVLNHSRMLLRPPQVLRAQIFVEAVVGPSSSNHADGNGSAGAAGSTAAAPTAPPDVDMEGSPYPMTMRSAAGQLPGDESVPPTPEAPGRPPSAEHGEAPAGGWAGEAMDTDRGSAAEHADPAAAAAEAAATGVAGLASSPEGAQQQQQQQGAAMELSPMGERGGGAAAAAAAAP